MSSDNTNPNLPEASSTSQPASNQGEEAISLLDIILVLLRRRHLIFWSIVCGGVLALLLALISTPSYTSWAKVIREVESEAAGANFSGAALLRGFGFNVGGNSTGLVANAYPVVALSREVRQMVVRDTFYFAEFGTSMTFVDYIHKEPGLGEKIWMYTLGLPRTIRRALRKQPALPLSAKDGQIYPTRKEEEAIKKIAEYVSIAVDEETGLMTLAVTAHHPLLAAQMAESFTKHLAERVRTIRTQKAREDLAFISSQFEEAGESLRIAENTLARFEDRNLNPQRAQLRTEHERLQRQVSFKSELYSDLQAQLTQAHIELQRSEPVITILEKPVPPIETSGASRVLLVIFGFILGGFVGLGLAFVKQYVQTQKSMGDERQKMKEIQHLWQSSWLYKRFGKQKHKGHSDL